MVFFFLYEPNKNANEQSSKPNNEFFKWIEENLMQIHQPTWCCINYCVIAHKWVVIPSFYSALSILLTFGSFNQILCNESEWNTECWFKTILFIQWLNFRRAANAHFSRRVRASERNGSDVNYKCILNTINNFGASIFNCTLRLDADFQANATHYLRPEYNFCFILFSFLYLHTVKIYGWLGRWLLTSGRPR